jgi:hypothetical protein
MMRESPDNSAPFGVTFEWFRGDDPVGRIEMDGPQWDGFYRLSARLAPATCDQLHAKFEVARIDLCDLAYKPTTRTRAFLSVEALNEFLASGESL